MPIVGGFTHKALSLCAVLLLQACTQDEPEYAKRRPRASFVRPPPEFESEVADNLFWMTEPPGARFDVPAMQPHHRFVLFPKPATYQVWARSAYPTDAKSNVVTVRVLEK